MSTYFERAHTVPAVPVALQSNFKQNEGNTGSMLTGLTPILSPFEMLVARCS